MAADCGMVLPRPEDESGTLMLSRATFQELLDSEPGELRRCHKLTRLHIEVIVHLHLCFFFTGT